MLYSLGIMFYPDLSPADGEEAEHFRMKSWENYDSGLPVLCVGWLESPHPYSQGAVSARFAEALRALCHAPLWISLGYHTCDFCGANPLVEGGDTFLGCFNIEVVGKEAAYYAPAMILHYVEKHDYLPPQGFIDAVLAAKEKQDDIQIKESGKTPRLEFKDDNTREEYWYWPVARTPDTNGLSEFVLIFREERDARLVQHEFDTRLAQLESDARIFQSDLGHACAVGHPCHVGEMNLEAWVEGKANLKMGALRETTPGDRFPRLKSAFYLQAFTTNQEIMHCLRAVTNDFILRNRQDQGIDVSESSLES